MAMVQVSWPLPAERTEEHYRFQDASRRYWIRVSGIFFEWFMVIVLLGVALMHAMSPWPTCAAVWRWLVLACCFAVWGYGDDRDVPREAAVESDGPRTAAGGKLEDAVRARVVFRNGPGVSDLVCDLVRRDSGFHLVSAVQAAILKVDPPTPN